MMTSDLASSSFGAVYKAKHRATGELFAIKKVPADNDFSEIVREIDIMKGCKSDYIITYFANYFLAEELWVMNCETIVRHAYIADCDGILSGGVSR